ncbi:hypothetical protein MD588_11170 [Photobacterium sp. SDRW27]|nr:hypothetical protein [Photobacterium obscurum]MCW8329368.1 hypothetical protein [Photobacterium obscurum]
MSITITVSKVGFGGNMNRDWVDIAMVTGWIAAWGVLIYMIPAVGI